MSIRRETAVPPARTDTPALRRLLGCSTALTTAAVCGWLLAAGPAWALPTGGNVVEGQATITYGTDSVTIQQGSDRVIIEWDTFNVGEGSRVDFIQEDFMAALNRVLGGGPSQILGAINAGGTVVISNPSGVVFGPSASVDVQSIVATSLDIMNSRFMAGDLTFDQAGDPTAVVSNAGEITIGEAGLAALVAPGVENSGIIRAQAGTVALASGNAVTIDLYGDGLVQLAVTSPTTAVPERADGTELDALVTNHPDGAIYADAGSVILTAEAAQGLIDNVINLDGIVVANTISDVGGQVALVGGQHGRVTVLGEILAQGDDAGEAGGTVHVLGEQVALADGGSIDVSGQAGGGDILVGGDYLGGPQRDVSGLQYIEPAAGGVGTVISTGPAVEAGGYIQTAELTYFAEGASAKADATQDGDGGNVIVWADDTTVFAGTISARGGAQGGDGGFVETSGAGRLGVMATASVDALAPNGRVGDWLLDPRTVTVQDGGATLAQIADASDTTSDLSVDPTVLNAATANISIVASETITFAEEVVLANAGVGLTATAGQRIIVDAGIRTNNGDITFVSDDMAINTVLNAGTGTVTLRAATAGRAIDIGTETSGSLSLTMAELDQIIADALVIGSADSGALTVSEEIFEPPAVALTLLAGGEIAVNAPIIWEQAGGGVSLFSRASIRANAAILNNDFGAITLVAGWDGTTTDIDTILNTPTTYGFGGGLIEIGNGSQIEGVAVGSVGGASNFAGAAMTLRGGDGAEQYAQAGFRNPDEVDFGIGGDIVIALSDGAGNAGNLTATAGSAEGAYAQVGHGGLGSSDPSRPPDGNYGGDITIRLANDLTFQAGNSVDAYAQLGHGGVNADGTHQGKITISQARDLTFRAGDEDRTYAQLGHGGYGADGDHQGDIVITAARNLTFEALALGSGAYAQLGHGGLAIEGNLSGAITVAQAANLTLAGGVFITPSLGNYAQIGHGAAPSDSSRGTRQGNIDIRVTGETSLVDGNRVDNIWLIGHATETDNGISDADVALRSGTLDFATATTSTQFAITADAPGQDFAARMIANLAGGSVTLAATNGTAGETGGMLVASPIVYDSTNALSLFSTSDIRFAANVQNNGAGAVNIVAGWDGTTVDIAAILTAPTTYGFGGGALFIGNGDQTAGIAVGSRFGASNFAGAAMTLLASTGTENAYAQAGFRDPDAASIDTINGKITIALSDGAGSAGDLTARAGSQRFSYVQVGHGGADLRDSSAPDGDYAGDITVVLANDLTFAAGGGRFAYAQLGHGGEFATGDFSGNILITQANNLTFTGGSGLDATAMLGHGGEDARGNHSGSITISRANDLVFRAGTEGDTFAQLGHGGGLALGNHRGDILISQANDLIFTGGVGGVRSGRYAQLGHGGDGTSRSQSGTITITQVRDIIFTGGTNSTDYVLLGHGGEGAQGNHDGAITIGQARDLTFVAGAAGKSFAQLGHGGVGADGDHSAIIDVTVVRNLTLTGGDTVDRYARIGHGDESGDGDAGNTANGDVFVRVGGDATLTNAVIGHLIDETAGYTGGNTFIGVGGVLTADAASRFNSAPTGVGELRIYVVSPEDDRVDTAALLNGSAHGDARAPNNQGQVLFGAGDYAPDLTLGNFAYYTLDVDAYNYNYIVDTAAEAAAIAAALADGNLLLDTTDGQNVGFATLRTLGALLDLNSVNPDGTPNLADTSYIEISEAIGYDSANALSLFSTGDVIFNASVQNNGTGAVNIVAGWDGVIQDIGDILVTPSSYGLASDIVIGDGTQIAGIVIGSRFGASNFAGKTMTLRGSDVAEDGFAQAGFRDPGTDNLGSDGTITIALSDGAGTAGDLTATAGSQRGSYVQVGHGGSDADPNANEPDGNYRGDITVILANDLIFTGGGTFGYAQLGHGGYNAHGVHTGAITITSANDLVFAAGTGSASYVQLGHGGDGAGGGHGGSITIARANDLIFTGGPGDRGSDRYAQLGHGGQDADGGHTGDILISQARDLRFTGGGRTDGYAQLGHGGDNADGDHTGAITITWANDVIFAAGPGSDTYAQLGHGGDGASGKHGGTITISRANDLIFTGGLGASGSSRFAQLGHGGDGAVGNHTGDILISEARDLIFTGGGGSDGYAQLGHGGDDAADNHSGTITITQAGNLTFTGGTGSDAYTQFGHGGADADGNHSGDIRIDQAGNLTFIAGTGEDAYAQFGHGGYDANGNHSGTITLGRATDLTFVAGNSVEGRAYAQLGHGGYNADGNHSGDIDITQAGNLTFTGGLRNSYAQLGHGGAIADGSQSGAIVIRQAGNLTFTGGFNLLAYAQLGHGGDAFDGSSSGAITIGQALDLTFDAGSGRVTYAQLGHGGNSRDGNHGGAITIGQANTLTLIGGTASSAYAQVGHGAASGFGTGTRTGAIDIRITGETSLVNGTGDGGPWLIGHATEDVGGVSNADVSLRTGTLDFSAVTASTLFAITADADGADFAAKMIANLAGGRVTLAATNGTAGPAGGMLVASPFVYDSAHALSLFSTTDIRFAASVQNGLVAVPGQGGAVNVVAGWDGTTTDIVTILANPFTYGLGGGAIFIGSGDQTAGIAVGSRFGASTFAGGAMTLRGSDNPAAINGFAQAGFRDTGAAVDTIDGAITIALSEEGGGTGNLTATGGSRDNSYAQVGQGGSDFPINIQDTDGDYAGEISVRRANDLIFTAGAGEGAHAQLGHGGRTADGNHSGAITIVRARDLVFAGAGISGYAQLGHGGLNADGDHSGMITVVQARDASFTAGTSSSSFAQIGHGGQDTDGNQRGAIDVTLLRNLTLTGPTDNTARHYVRIGHGDERDSGDDANESVRGDVFVLVGGTATLTNAGIGHEIESNGTYFSGNTFIGAGLGLTADAASRFNSAAPNGNDGQLRIYVPAGGDGVDEDALLNGIRHGVARAPNNQGPAAFGAGDYDISTAPGNFAYYTLDLGNAFNYFVDTAEAAAIVAALQAPGAVTLDTAQNLARFGAVPDLDGGTSFIQVNADIVYASDQLLRLLATGSVDVNANITSTGTGGLTFDAPTVNLNGNLTAARNAITGSATVVNILSSTGGAQINDAIDVVAVGGNINIAAGIYGSYVVDKENLTIRGVGAGTIIRASSPAVTINVNGTVVRDQAFTGTGAVDDVGILLNGDPSFQGDPNDPNSFGSANLTRIQIINVDISNMDDGIRSVGDIGDGDPTTVDVVIRGNSNTDRAVLEDFLGDAIDVGDTDGDAVYLIRDLTLQDGADADDVVAVENGIRINADVGAVTIHGVVMTANAGDDGISFTETLNNATVIIGSTTPGDANTILGQFDGIRTVSINGGSFTIQGNTRIFATDDGIDLNGEISNNARIDILDNVEISANEDAIDMNAITGSRVTIARNRLIQSTGADASDAIEFGGDITAGSVILIDGNTNIIGVDDGIDINDPVIDSRLSITNNQRIEGQRLDFGDGIQFEDPFGGTTVVLIDGNTTIVGRDDGIDFNDDITAGTVTISNNALIQGTDEGGIEFEERVTGSVAVVITGNTSITGRLAAIDFQKAIEGTATVRIDRNGTATQNGAAYDGSAAVDLTGFAIGGALTGGIRFSDMGGESRTTVSRNIIGGGNGNGITFGGSIGTVGDTAVHNNVILGNGGNGIAFQGNVASRTEVFQNFIARNGGSGIQVAPTAGLSPGSLFVQVNFLPGQGFADGNGGFGYSQAGDGTANLEGNWWGTAGPDFATAINGVPLASLPALIVTATGDDDGNVPPAFANTVFEPFAFQPGSITAPLTGDSAALLGLADLPDLSDFFLLGITGPESETNNPGGDLFRTNAQGAGFQTAPFADGNPIGSTNGGPEPAGGGSPLNLDGIEPAAGGPGSEETAADSCLDTYLASNWDADEACSP